MKTFQKEGSDKIVRPLALLLCITHPKILVRIIPTAITITNVVEVRYGSCRKFVVPSEIDVGAIKRSDYQVPAKTTKCNPMPR